MATCHVVVEIIWQKDRQMCDFSRNPHILKLRAIIRMFDNSSVCQEFVKRLLTAAIITEPLRCVVSLSGCCCLVNMWFIYSVAVRKTFLQFLSLAWLVWLGIERCLCVFTAFPIRCCSSSVTILSLFFTLASVTVRYLCPLGLFFFVSSLHITLWQCQFHHLVSEAPDKVFSADAVWGKVGFSCHPSLVTGVSKQPLEPPDDLLPLRLYFLFVSCPSVWLLFCFLKRDKTFPPACAPLWGKATLSYKQVTQLRHLAYSDIKRVTGACTHLTHFTFCL